MANFKKFKTDDSSGDEKIILINIDNINCVEPLINNHNFRYFLSIGKDYGYYVTNTEEELTDLLEIK